jgi:regulator of replication initiation timing
MLGLKAYSVGYDAGRSDEQTGNGRREIVHQILYGERPVTVDQSYIDRLHAALANANATSDHNFDKAELFHSEALSWKEKAHQFRNEALYWRDQKFAPLKAKAKARREENAVLQHENAVLLARLKERNPDLAEEQAAHDETFKEKQSLQRFRVLAASLIDALLVGRADQPEFAELLTIAKDAADTIERGDLFTAFRDEPEKNNRLCSLADALQKP